MVFKDFASAYLKCLRAIKCSYVVVYHPIIQVGLSCFTVFDWLSFVCYSQSKDSVISEVLIVGIGNNGSRPHLFAMLDQDLVIYEAFPFSTTTTEKHLLLRFRKVRPRSNVEHVMCRT